MINQQIMVKDKVLVTGSAGFIGFHLCKRLLDEGFQVIGLDQINSYYDINLKYNRLNELGIIKKDIKENKLMKSISFNSFYFVKTDLENKGELDNLFKKERFDIIINLAAQAGVRYSISNPDVYISSNIIGYFNILDLCKKYEVKNLVYASSSSVYGKNKNLPFNENDFVDNPISLYAASKKSNELISHAYSHLFGIKTVGLRFFTVYGPWGRPDMALFLFVKAALENKEIKVFNNGKMIRDFTYIDDIIEGIFRVSISLINNKTSNYNIYNIGNNNPVNLMDFISAIEKKLNLVIKKKMMSIQPGDVKSTFADVNKLVKDLDYKPSVGIDKGISEFIDWYKDYYY